MPSSYSYRGRASATWRFQTGTCLVVLSSIFNVLLCYISTRGWLYVSSGVVAAVEMAILVAGFIVIRKMISRQIVIVTGLSVAYMIGAKLINPDLSLKILHDFAIAYIFYQMGRMYGISQARSAVLITMVLTLALGAFEIASPVAFGEFFNIWRYYVQKGGISATTINYSNTTFFASGDRIGVKRTFFPFLLGPHRVSSIFLEPVSLGNYATIIFAWCLATCRNRPGQRRILLFALCFACIVLCDSRFGSICCALMVFFRISPLRSSSLVAFIMPVCFATMLTVAGSLHEIPGWVPTIRSDDFSGRLLFSGELLNYWNLSEWFAFSPSAIYTADTGYAYIFNSLGVPFALVYTALFAFSKCRNQTASMMRTGISVYFSASLCIGASVFSIKTAALLWMLYGATQTPDQSPRRA
ncbi:polysaccharide polymerase [Acetobacter sp. LMG 1636]|uniref:Polysaccharide polymerase n=1 Tax=Acetobacter fallax TaxID=1737473 RepID=A0ABX0K8X4_9PROT|nr:polysaccharide polymerase [Acetobacter fallax]NHO35363.1 polysaccharide polymerase [Acetobacter fallax]